MVRRSSSKRRATRRWWRTKSICPGPRCRSPNHCSCMLSFEGTKLRDIQTLAECNARKESEINVGLRPVATMITLNVGGVRHE